MKLALQMQKYQTLSCLSLIEIAAATSGCSIYDIKYCNLGGFARGLVLNCWRASNKPIFVPVGAEEGLPSALTRALNIVNASQLLHGLARTTDKRTRVETRTLRYDMNGHYRLTAGKRGHGG